MTDLSPDFSEGGDFLTHTAPDVLSDAMISRAIVRSGNSARLAAVMQKAQRGEPVTIATIGGSVTQGCAASDPTNSYPARVARWWETAFPTAKIRLVNAGIGATDSYLGVHRVQTDVLSAQPDLVVVEFSVNDTDPTLHSESFDSLVRRLLLCDTQPAVLLLCLTQRDGTSLQSVHAQIGAAYDLPIIRYKDTVLPEIAAGHLQWADISPDDIHPNDRGHAIIAALFAAYFSGVRETLSSVDTSDLAFSAPPVTVDKYRTARLLDSTAITPDLIEGFAPRDTFFAFPHGWATDGGGTLTFAVTGQNLGVLFLRTTDGSHGTYAVSVDGKQTTLLNGDFSGGWGDYAAATECFTSSSPAPHRLTISPANDTARKAFAVLGILVS